MNTTATTNPPTTVALPQPSSAPWITPYSSANSETAMVIWPGQSSERPCGADEFWAKASVIAALIAASTAMARKA